MHAPERHPRIRSLLLAAAAFVVVAAGLEGRGLPRGAALLVVVLAAVGVLLGLSVVVGASVNDFTNDLPRCTERLKGQFGALMETLRGLGVELPRDRQGVAERVNPARVLQLAGQLFNGFGAVLANAFLILLAVAFLLLEASSFFGKLYAIARDAHLTRAGVDAFTGTVRRYLAIKSLMSLGTGAAAWLWLSLLGVDYPILRGLLAFLLTSSPTSGRSSRPCRRCFSPSSSSDRRPRSGRRPVTSRSTSSSATCSNPGSWAAASASPRWWCSSGAPFAPATGSPGRPSWPSASRPPFFPPAPPRG